MSRFNRNIKDVFWMTYQPLLGELIVNTLGAHGTRSREPGCGQHHAHSGWLALRILVIFATIKINDMNLYGGIARHIQFPGHRFRNEDEPSNHHTGDRRPGY